uniref:BTB and MATH domain-containing protein 38 n=1 Tax=Magallana gigas TaxID=29159 RepID=K1R8J7_MAGGI
MDFMNATHWNKTYNGQTLKTPLSCCKGIEGEFPDIKYPAESCATSPDDTNNNRNKGCYSAIEDFINKYSNIFIGIGVVVAIFEILCIVFAIIVCRNVEEGDKMIRLIHMQNMAETRVTSLATDLGFPKTDVTLVVEDQKIHVNKAVLSEHSPVFNAMFNSEFKESTAVEITLEGKRAADVAEFLKCFYPNMKHTITAENVLQVLPLAHEYQSSLVADCENCMIDMCKQEKGLTVSTLLDYMLAGDKYVWLICILAPYFCSFHCEPRNMRIDKPHSDFVICRFRNGQCEFRIEWESGKRTWESDTVFSDEMLQDINRQYTVKGDRQKYTK